MQSWKWHENFVKINVLHQKQVWWKLEKDLAHQVEFGRLRQVVELSGQKNGKQHELLKAGCTSSGKDKCMLLSDVVPVELLKD